MISLWIFILLLLSVLLIKTFENYILKRKNIFFLPFIIMCFVILFHMLFELVFDYPPLRIKSILLIIWGLYVLTFSSIFFPLGKVIDLNEKKKKFINKLIIPIGSVGIIVLVLFYNFLKSQGTFSLIKLNDESINTVNTYVFFQIYFTPLIFYSVIKRPLKILLITINLLGLFLTFVKGTILISILSIVVYYIVILNRKISVKFFLAIGFFGFLFFMSSYLIPSLFIETTNDYTYYFKKFGQYLFAGIEGFSIIMTESNYSVYLPLEVLFAPLINFIANLTDVTDNIRVLDYAGLNKVNIRGVDNNVFSFFGTIYIASGFNFMMYTAIILLFGLITNFILFISKYFKLFFTSIAFSIWLSCFYLSFFEFYYWHSFLYYQLIFGIFLDFIYLLYTNYINVKKTY